MIKDSSAEGDTRLPRSAAQSLIMVGVAVMIEVSGAGSGIHRPRPDLEARWRPEGRRRPRGRATVPGALAKPRPSLVRAIIPPVSDHPAPARPAADADRADADHAVPWSTRLILTFVVLVALVAGGLIATARLADAWARRIVGAVIAVVAGWLLGRVVHRHARWWARLVWLVLAAVVAGPALVTLGITLGGDDATRAARRLLDDGAPAFRGALAAGMVLGAVLAVVRVLSRARRHRPEPDGDPDRRPDDEPPAEPPAERTPGHRGDHRDREGRPSDGDGPEE